MPEPRGLDAPALAEQGYKLVKQASDQYRRAGTRLERARKSLRDAERAFDQAKRDLKCAIDAVQPSLDLPDHGDAGLLP